VVCPAEIEAGESATSGWMNKDSAKQQATQTALFARSSNNNIDRSLDGKPYYSHTAECCG